MKKTEIILTINSIQNTRSVIFALDNILFGSLPYYVKYIHIKYLKNNINFNIIIYI